jgi:hypothetical protein
MHDVIVKALWIYGLAIVVSMAVAVIIKLVVVILNAFDRKPEAAPKSVAAVAEPAFDVLADHVVAISAAVYSMIGAHRIIHIEDQRHTEWAGEGRMAHHASHTVSHHPKH